MFDHDLLANLLTLRLPILLDHLVHGSAEEVSESRGKLLLWLLLRLRLWILSRYIVLSLHITTFGGLLCLHLLINGSCCSCRWCLFSNLFNGGRDIYNRLLTLIFTTLLCHCVYLSVCLFFSNHYKIFSLEDILF